VGLVRQPHWLTGKMAGLDGLPDAAERLNVDAMAVHAVIRDARIAERANIGRAKTGAAIRLAASLAVEHAE
jgi:hypothetical protein